MLAKTLSSHGLWARVSVQVADFVCPPLPRLSLPAPLSNTHTNAPLQMPRKSPNIIFLSFNDEKNILTMHLKLPLTLCLIAKRDDLLWFPLDFVTIYFSCFINMHKMIHIYKHKMASNGINIAAVGFTLFFKRLWRRTWCSQIFNKSALQIFVES